MSEREIYYRRHLPHYEPEGGTFHVVFRLAGSLPAEVIARLRIDRERTKRELSKTENELERAKLLREHRWTYFERFDALLEGNIEGPLWLKQAEAASIVKEALHHYDGNTYDLLAYCIMPNHVHMVFVLLPLSVGRFSRTDRNDGTGVPSYILAGILGSIKKFTARRINKLLDRSGTLWQDESDDHVIRDSNELERTIWYVLNNPVKAGLVDSWKKWSWTYCKPGLL
jgi:REP element-mobilizing transposase RayT